MSTDSNDGGTETVVEPTVEEKAKEQAEQVTALEKERDAVTAEREQAAAKSRGFQAELTRVHQGHKLPTWAEKLGYKDVETLTADLEKAKAAVQPDTQTADPFIAEEDDPAGEVPAVDLEKVVRKVFREEKDKDAQTELAAQMESEEKDVKASIADADIDYIDDADKMAFEGAVQALVDGISGADSTATRQQIDEMVALQKERRGTSASTSGDTGREPPEVHGSGPSGKPPEKTWEEKSPEERAKEYPARAAAIAKAVREQREKDRRRFSV